MVHFCGCLTGEAFGNGVFHSFVHAREPYSGMEEGLHASNACLTVVGCVQNPLANVFRARKNLCMRYGDFVSFYYAEFAPCPVISCIYDLFGLAPWVMAFTMCF